MSSCKISSKSEISHLIFCVVIVLISQCLLYLGSYCDFGDFRKIEEGILGRA